MNGPTKRVGPPLTLLPARKGLVSLDTADVVIDGLTLAAMQAVHLIGMPEGALALAEAAIYLALAPKSNRLYTAYQAAQHDLEKTVAEPVPLHLRNAPTPLMKAEGYGAGYEYAHDLEEKVSAMPCLPPSLEGRQYYHTTQQGLEEEFRKRLEEIRDRRRAAQKPALNT